jgi:hypothetical protein
MDPVNVAATAIAFVTPYLLDFGKDAAKDATKDAAKSVWSWIKGKLTSPGGLEAMADVERAPDKPENAQALQAALTKALVNDPGTTNALADLLKNHGVSTCPD